MSGQGRGSFGGSRISGVCVSYHVRVLIVSGQK